MSDARPRPLPPMPARIVRLPLDPRGFPIPFFVCRDPLDFRVIAPGAWEACHKRKLCWVCGEPLGRNLSFVAGPMCGINRTTSEPPSHLECACWSAQACPFLSRPKMRRNDRDMPEGKIAPAGTHLDRNPGVAMVWTTRSYKPFRVPGGGVLIEMGPADSVRWFALGREATREEVEASITSGLPHLWDAVNTEDTPGRRDAAGRQLLQQIADFQRWLPLPAVALQGAI